jgi:hypothetical protein
VEEVDQIYHLAQLLIEELEVVELEVIVLLFQEELQ